MTRPVDKSRHELMADQMKHEMSVKQGMDEAKDLIRRMRGQGDLDKPPELLNETLDDVASSVEHTLEQNFPHLEKGKVEFKPETPRPPCPVPPKWGPQGVEGLRAMGVDTDSVREQIKRVEKASIERTDSVLDPVLADLKTKFRETVTYDPEKEEEATRQRLAWEASNRDAEENQRDAALWRQMLDVLGRHATFFGFPMSSPFTLPTLLESLLKDVQRDHEYMLAYWGGSHDMVLREQLLHHFEKAVEKKAADELHDLRRDHAVLKRQYQNAVAQTLKDPSDREAELIKLCEDLKKKTEWMSAELVNRRKMEVELVKINEQLMAEIKNIRDKADVEYVRSQIFKGLRIDNGEQLQGLKEAANTLTEWFNRHVPTTNAEGPKSPGKALKADPADFRHPDHDHDL